MEGHRNGRKAAFSGVIAQTRKDQRVPAVHAVEFADGQGPAAQVFRYSVDRCDGFHGIFR